MTSISPIPTTRISDSLISSRLVAQLQFNQQDIFAIQTQLSTGRRLARPSDDAPSAVRAISLQRLIERKVQVQVNLQTNQSYLSATDSSLNSVSSIIADIRGAALSVADTTSTDAQRTAVASEVQRAIQQLVDTGNQQFRGRYLFAGSSTTVLPFEYQDGFVAYHGNENVLRSFSDIDVLFESSIAGTEVFGALSEEVLGTSDLNPVLTASTQLRDLHGGAGISKGSITVSDGTLSSVVDISSAETIGDVARLIETNPPAGRTVSVSIRPTGLYIEIDAAGGGNLSITEVAGGTTARQLGILKEAGVGINPITGGDLNPILRLGTGIDQIFGSYAQGRIESTGANNDIIFQAAAVGAALNDVTVQFVDDRLLLASPGLSAGNEYAHYETEAVAARASLAFAGSDNDLILEATTPGTDFNNVTVRVTSAAVRAPTASYDSASKTLTIDLEADGSSTANDVVGAIGLIAGTPFTATLDTSVETTNTGGGAIAALNDANFASTGNSGGAAGTLYIHIDPGDTLANQVVEAINAEGTFRAEVDNRDAIIPVQSGFGAIELAATVTTAGGSGTAFDQTGIQINNGGETFELSFATAETVEDVLNVINGSGAGVVAQISSDGNSINIRSRLSGSNFSVGENGGSTAGQLGLRTFTADTRLESLNRGLGVADYAGDDFTIETSDGTTFNIDVDGAQTIGDILDRINSHTDNPGNVTARLAEFGNGIEIVENDPPGPGTLQIQAVTISQAAIHLGLIAADTTNATASTAAVATDVADLGVANSDITFSARTGGTALNGAQVQFVNNLAAGDQALVSYDAGTNILTIDVDPAATQTTTIVDAVNNQVGGLFAAALNTDEGANDGSGIVGDTGTAATLGGGSDSTLTGGDVNPRQVDGLFNTLLRLETALRNNDIIGIQAGITELEVDLDRVNFGRAEIGARQRGLDILQTRLQDEEIELRGSLSVEIDVDIAAAISDLTSRQLASEASLRSIASILQLTLLNFL